MRRLIITIALLIITLVVVFGLPKPKYTSPNIIPTLLIPQYPAGWESLDVSKKLDLGDARYNFISNVFARVYARSASEHLLFLVLDAGNFHNPKICFGSSGYKPVDIPNPEFTVAGRTFKAQAVLFSGKEEQLLVVYWICINRKIVDWTGQKLVQLWYSLFNKEKTGLMVRMDISVKNSDTAPALSLARDFIATIGAALPTEQREFLFGK